MLKSFMGTFNKLSNKPTIFASHFRNSEVMFTVSIKKLNAVRLEDPALKKQTSTSAGRLSCLKVDNFLMSALKRKVNKFIFVMFGSRIPDIIKNIKSPERLRGQHYMPDLILPQSLRGFFFKP